MSGGVRVPFLVAEAAATDLVARLRPGCERIEIAGSVRRGGPGIGDLEIVAIPRIEQEPDTSVLFGGMLDVSRLDERIAELRLEGILRPSDLPRDGERYKAFVHVPSGLGLDLFIVRPPATWGVIFTIRTGPAAYSQRLVTEARRRGFHHADGALHRGSMGCTRFSACEVIPTPEEVDLFEALGMPYLEPGARR